jgi:hypothetical protein
MIRGVLAGHLTGMVDARSVFLRVLRGLVCLLISLPLSVYILLQRRMQETGRAW